MQVTKDRRRRLLFETARNAFFERGFRAVSMRDIARESGVSLSNIYNYYTSKDDLLAEVLRPLLEAMRRMVENHNRLEDFSVDLFTSEEFYRASIREVMDIVTCYRQECRLLFFSDSDSCFRDYVERWVARSTELGMEYMVRVHGLHPSLCTDVSPLFMRFACSWWISMMREVVRHEELSEEEIAHFIGEYVRFNTGGWERLMGVGHANGNGAVGP